MMPSQERFARTARHVAWRAASASLLYFTTMAMIVVTVVILTCEARP